MKASVSKRRPCLLPLLSFDAGVLRRSDEQSFPPNKMPAGRPGLGCARPGFWQPSALQTVRVHGHRRLRSSTPSLLAPICWRGANPPRRTGERRNQRKTLDRPARPPPRVPGTPQRLTPPASNLQSSIIHGQSYGPSAHRPCSLLITRHLALVTVLWAGALHAEAVRCILPLGREMKSEILVYSLPNRYLPAFGVAIELMAGRKEGHSAWIPKNQKRLPPNFRGGNFF